MRWGIVVRTFLVEGRARDESARLAAASGLPGRVLIVREGGTEVYRLVLGAWDDRASADRGASELLRKGLVDEARVVTIGRAPAPSPSPAP
jgi:hypothetical protein